MTNRPLKTFLTEYEVVVSHKKHVYHTYCGKEVKATSFKKAKKWCRKNAPHLRVVGEFVPRTKKRVL